MLMWKYIGRHRRARRRRGGGGSSGGGGGVVNAEAQNGDWTERRACTSITNIGSTLTLYGRSRRDARARRSVSAAYRDLRDSGTLFIAFLLLAELSYILDSDEKPTTRHVCFDDAIEIRKSSQSYCTTTYAQFVP